MLYHNRFLRAVSHLGKAKVMGRNRGATSLPCRRRKGNGLTDYDRLPPELRAWLAHADLPWSVRSARTAFERALARTSCPARAVADLDRMQRKQIAKDAARIWGRDHPAANS